MGPQRGGRLPCHCPHLRREAQQGFRRERWCAARNRALSQIRGVPSAGVAPMYKIVQTNAVRPLTMSAVYHRGRANPGVVPTGDGEHNVIAYSTDPTTTSIRGDNHDVDFTYRSCHVPRNSVCRPHATAGVGCATSPPSLSLHLSWSWLAP
jgi:hypothetical protein